MEERHVSQEMLAARTDANPRWIVEVTTNPEWHPKLDTILRLCLALRYDVISFLELAEVGSRGLAPSSKLQAPSSKLQAPSSKLQAPSSKLQAPSSKLQAPSKEDFTLEEQMLLLLEVMPFHVSRALRAARLEAGLSQRKLSKLTTFSVCSISLREGYRNTSYPTVTTLGLYCEAFKIELAQFMAWVFFFTRQDQGLMPIDSLKLYEKW